jgi:hypothetical protein
MSSVFKPSLFSQTVFTDSVFKLSSFDEPVFTWDFTRGNMPSIIDFSSASTGTALVDGTLTTFAVDAPRLNEDGLLIEATATNLIINPNKLASLGWNFFGKTPVENSGISPDGTNNANLYDVTSGFKVNWYDNIAAGFIAGAETAFTPTTEWERLSFTITAPAGCVSLRFYPYRDSASFFQNISVTPGQQYTGSMWVKLNGSGQLLVYGVQVEQGSYATSFINGGSSTGTRADDVAVEYDLNDINFNPTEGTFVVEFTPRFLSKDFQTALSLGSGSIANMACVRIRGDNDNLEYAVFSGSTQFVGIPLATPAVAGTTYKIAFTYKTDDFAACVNGGTVGTDNSGTLPAGITALFVGAATASARFANGTIKKLTYYATRLSNTRLQELTS